MVTIRVWKPGYFETITRPDGDFDRLNEEVRTIDEAFAAASEEDRVKWKEWLESGGALDLDLQRGDPDRFVSSTRAKFGQHLVLPQKEYADSV